MGWKVWFDDTTTFSNAQGAIAEIPNKGVVVVAINAASGGPQVVHSMDWYVYSGGLGFRGLAVHELLRQLCNSPGTFTLVRQGAVISDTAYTSMINAANAYAAS